MKTQWTTLQKTLFRFIGTYLVIYCLSNQFVTSFLLQFLWELIVPWFSASVLAIEGVEAKTTGSGDTTFSYVSLLIYLLVSLLITLIWSVLDRKRPNYEKLFHWLEVLVRYYLVYQMVVYGMAKIFYLQFQPPGLARLIQPLGDFSPMGLLWTFMGYSKGYSMFAGFGELIGGLLLLFRRTQTLGAVIVLGVMGNVMAMNFFYDVPVKILSTHLVMLATFLIALDAKRLWQVFIKNEPISARHFAPHFKDNNLESVKNIIKGLLITAGVGIGIFAMVNLKTMFGNKKASLYGLYEVESFEKNGQIAPPLLTDTLRWRRLIVEYKGGATIQFMNDKKVRYDFDTDTTQYTVTLKPSKDTSAYAAVWDYKLPDTSHLLLEGVYDTDTLKILMKRKRKEDFLLINRGFRWINETPFNR